MEWSATPCSPSLPGDVAYAPHTLPCTPMHTQIDQAARAENIFFGLAKSLADGTTEVLPRRGSELGGLAPLPPRYDYESVSALDMNSEDIDSRPPQFVSASTCVLRARTCLLLEGIPAVLTAFSSLLFGNPAASVFSRCQVTHTITEKGQEKDVLVSIAKSLWVFSLKKSYPSTMHQVCRSERIL